MEPASPSLTATTLSQHQVSLTARWQETLAGCREKLRKSEVQHASCFTTLDDIEVYLGGQGGEHSDVTVQKSVAQLYPCLSTLRGFLLLLMNSSPPLCVDTELFFGLLYLIITGAIGSAQMLARLVEMLSKFRKELAYFQSCAPHVVADQELQTSGVDCLVILIEFWVKVQELFRKKTQEKLIEEGWPTLFSAFEVAMGKLNDAVENVRRHALLELSGASSKHAMLLANATNHLNKLKLTEAAEAVFPCFSLPAKSPYFYGREAEIVQMSDYFEEAHKLDELRTFVLFGEGGCGKTSTALAYAYRCKALEIYDVIFWIRSQTKADIHDSFVQIAYALGLTGDSMAQDSEDLELRIKNWLGKTRKKWMLVYDNVEDPDVLQAVLPAGNGHVLVTTRYKWLAFKTKGSMMHELSTFDDTQSLEMFEGVCAIYDPATNRSLERAQVKLLLEELGGLAIAIEQIAAYVSYRGASIEKFRLQYGRSFQRIHAHSDVSSGEKNLATLWEVQFTAIRDTTAAKALGFLSLLAPDSIPVSLFVPENDKEDEEMLKIIGYSEDDIEDAFDHLMRVALIKMSGGSIMMHRLVQKSFLQTHVGMKSSDLQPIFDAVCRALNHRFPKSDTGMSHFGRWEACAAYLPHVLSVTGLYEKRSRSANNKLSMPSDLVRLIRNCAWYLYECGDLTDCLSLLEIGKHGCTDESGLDYAYLCSHGACVLYELNDIPRGQELINKALEIRERLLDPGDGQLGNAYSNKGLLEASDCMYPEALRYFNAGLKIRQQLKNNYLAPNYILKGMVLVLMGDLEAAETNLELGGALCREGGSKMDMLRTLQLFWVGNLALLREDYQQAKKAFSEGLVIHERLAPTHLATAAYHYKLGFVDLRLAMIEPAITHLNCAIDIGKFRDADGEVARALRMKVVALKEKGELTEVEKFEAEDAELVRGEILRKHFKDKEAKMLELSEDEQYSLLICCERR